MAENKKRLSLAVAGLLLVVGVVGGVAGCAPTTSSGPAEQGESEAVQTSQDDEPLGLGGTVAAPSPSEIQGNRTATMPEVAETTEGVMAQRTPSEYPELKMWYYPEEELNGTYAYNIQALDADNRGCNACHADLAETLQHLDYPHVDLRNNFGINITVEMCIDCHTYQPLALAEQYGFKEMIHNIHYKAATDFQGDCMSCHAQYGDDPTLQLFDIVKYDLFRGVVDVANVEGTFNYRQDEKTELADLWNFPWYSYDHDYLREENEENNVPLDEDMFNNWTITVSGAVDKETTFKLKDMVDDGWGEEVTLTSICTMNPQGGPLVGNLTVKGIPVSRLLDEAGLADDATGFQTLAQDGYGYWTDINVFNQGHGGYLVYEIEGQPLSWANGYPVTYWVQGSGSAGQNSKMLSDIIVSNEPLDPNPCLGNPTEIFWNTENAETTNDGTFFTNKPNVGIFDTPQGEVVPVGESYTFHGYADCFEQPVTAVEFSMDNGMTWTHYDTPGTTSNNWVTWTLDFTPEARGAYVFAVRAIGENGITTADPVKVMINAKEA